jgi:hypothetical protein
MTMRAVLPETVLTKANFIATGVFPFRASKPLYDLFPGLVASRALHALLLLPYLISRFESDENDRSTLVFEMDGLVSNKQANEKVAMESSFSDASA